MNKLFCPAIFHKEGEGVWVSFPDIPECFAEGDSMEIAYEMAVDALGLAITSRKKEKQEIPKPSQADEVIVDEGILVIVEYDI